MWLSRKSAVVLLLLLLPGACGFQPLYRDKGANAHVLAALAGIYVEPINGRTGQIVRNHLLDILTPRGVPSKPEFRLSVKLSEIKKGLAIEQDDSVTRYNYTLKASYFLKKPGSNEVVHSGFAWSIASYNIVQSDFANLNAEKNAKRRTARSISDELKNQLAVYLSRQ